MQFQLVGISIDEMFDAQIATEVMASELAAQRATEADLERLRAVLKRASGHFSETNDGGIGVEIYYSSHGLSRRAG